MSRDLAILALQERVRELEGHRTQWRGRALRLHGAALAVVRHEWSLREKVPEDEPEWRALVGIIDEIEEAEPHKSVERKDDSR